MASITDAPLGASKRRIRPRALSSKYLSVFGAQVSNNLTYRWDLLIESFTIVLFLWVFVCFWRAAYHATGQESISGMTLRETIWYLVVAEVVILSRPRVVDAVAEAVRTGSIVALLTKPCSFLGYQLSMAGGDAAVRGVCNLLAGGALAWVMIGPPPHPQALVIVVPAIVLGWLVDFCLAAAIGLLAFVTEEVSAFDWIYSKALFVLGGMLIPLAFFPHWLRAIAEALPFAYIVYVPANLFVHPSLESAVVLLSAQLAWVVGLGAALVFAYSRAVRWLVINGG